MENKIKRLKYIFGPVPSRRLGLSLGVDLIPLKTCSYDCIYCQLIRTTVKTISREEYVSLEEIVEELKIKLREEPRPDYITLSGSGEPTLYSRIGELISEIKKLTSIPVAVITNSSLLWKEEVQESLLEADLLLPSLDVGDEGLFKYVNRPHPDISFEKMVNGLIEFSSKFKNTLWLEILLLGEITDCESEIRKIVPFASKMKPNKIQLNTASRPTAEKFALKVEKEKLDEFANLFEPKAEVIAEFKDDKKSPFNSISKEKALDLIKRRPCSLEDISAGLCINPNEALKILQEMVKNELIIKQYCNDKAFYVVRGNRIV